MGKVDGSVHLSLHKQETVAAVLPFDKLQDRGGKLKVRILIVND